MAGPTVYLAGPMVFEPDPDTTFDVMKEICARHGLRGVSPLDGQIALAGVEPGHALAEEIVGADIALMGDLDAGLFCLDGFRRGPEMDPGTAFEIGYMHALGKPMAGWTRDVRDYPARVRDYFTDRGDPDPTGQRAHGSGANSGAMYGRTSGTKSGTVRDPDGVLIHSEGCFQNAMTQIGIERSGGRVFADADWHLAVEAAVAALSDILRNRCVGRHVFACSPGADATR